MKDIILTKATDQRKIYYAMHKDYRMGFASKKFTYQNQLSIKAETMKRAEKILKKLMGKHIFIVKDPHLER